MSSSRLMLIRKETSHGFHVVGPDNNSLVRYGQVGVTQRMLSGTNRGRVELAVTVILVGDSLTVCIDIDDEIFLTIHNKHINKRLDYEINGITISAADYAGFVVLFAT
jgi:hypothetical protein